MILKGSQRAGGMHLANHLMNDVDNDHVTVHELRGFIAVDLHGAMKEAYAISRGTQRCRQFLFSLSLNPPERARVTVAEFEQAITKVEDRLGLTGQPRVIVFHEKEARRHCHVVWLRVDTSKMRAINLPYFKMKLRDQSRELFLEHGWRLPKGLLNTKDRDQLNYGLPEYQQSKRSGRDPKSIKSIIQECWKQSDDRSAFESALENRGFLLAKGDRRSFVAVDWEGNTYAVSRWVGVRAEAVREKLGLSDNIRTVDEAKVILAKEAGVDLQRKIDEECASFEKVEDEFIKQLFEMRRQQRSERSGLARRQEVERFYEIRHHAALLPTGLIAMWFRLTGQYGKIKEEIEQNVQQQMRTQAQERERLVRQQLLERQALQYERRRMRHERELRLVAIRTDISLPRHSKPQRSRRSYR